MRVWFDRHFRMNRYELPGHPQVNHQGDRSVGYDDDLLADPLDAFDPPAM